MQAQATSRLLSQPSIPFGPRWDLVLIWLLFSVPCIPWAMAYALAYPAFAVVSIELLVVILAIVPTSVAVGRWWSSASLIGVSDAGIEVTRRGKTLRVSWSSLTDLVRDQINLGSIDFPYLPDSSAITKPGFIRVSKSQARQIVMDPRFPRELRTNWLLKRAGLRT
jgi:hypothetical protein